MEQEYIITCKDEPSVDRLIQEITTPGLFPLNCPGLSGFNPIEEYMPYSKTQVVFKLNEIEAEILKNNPLVSSIELKTDLLAELHNNVFTNQNKNLNVNYNTSIITGEDNWGFARCSSLSGYRPWNNKFIYRKTGQNVDVVIIDSGITQNHPEFGPTGRVKMIDWTLYSPVTSPVTLDVTVEYGDFVINGVINDTVYVVRDAFNPTRSRTRVYNFLLDGITTLGKPFFIGTAIGTPYSSTYVTNNGADTGVVTLSVYSAADASLLGIQPNPDTMFYFGGALGGIISRTYYNTQASNEFYYSDTSGHGTHVTGTVAGSAFGWAPNANIYSIHLNFADSYGYSTDSLGVIRAYNDLWNWHDEKRVLGIGRPTVTNNSYGWGIGTTLESVNYAVKDLVDAGVHFVHSAGNNFGYITTALDPDFFKTKRSNIGFTLCREGSPTYPIYEWTNQYDNPVVTVGSIGTYAGDENSKADYSNYGPGVSIYAPGTYIISAWPNNTYGNYIISPFGVRKINGTSMASPQVAGILATILQDHPTLKPQEAKNFLISTAVIGAISSSEKHFDSFYGTLNHSLSGGANLTVNQYPASQIIIQYQRIIGQPEPSHTRFGTNCYIKTSETFNLNRMRYNTNAFMNSASDALFAVGGCP